MASIYIPVPRILYTPGAPEGGSSNQHWDVTGPDNKIISLIK